MAGRKVGSTAVTMLAASSLTTLGAIPPFLLAAQAVLIAEDLGFGAAGLGVAVSTFFAVAALVTIIGARMIEGWSRRVSTAAAGALVAAGGLMLAVLSRDWWSLVLAMAVLGAGNAACQVTSNFTLARVLPPRRRGLGFGVKQSAVPAAIMLGGLAVPTTTAALGWRSSFAITGVFGLLVVVLALLRSDTAGGQARGVRTSAWEGAPRGPLLLCGLAITCGSAAANFFGAYLATWAHDVGLTVTQAALLMSAGSASSIVVRVLIGMSADRRHGGNLAVVAGQMAIGGICLTMIGAVHQPWSVVTFGILAFALGWSWPGLLLYAVSRVGRDAPGQASSVVQAGAFLGGTVGPATFGLVVAQAGFTTAWWAAAASFAIAGALIMVARRGFRRDLVRRPPAQPFGYGGGRTDPRWVTGGESPDDNRRT